MHGKHVVAVPGIMLLVVVTIALAACGSHAGRNAAGPARPLTTITVAMGYIPNVQFAPFYVAQTRGYYRRAGLNVKFEFTIEPNALRLLSGGKVDFVNSGGDEVLLAGAEGLHVRYVMTQYSRFPAALFFLRSSGIRRLAGLHGRSIGIPGRYGASYIGLRELLRAGHVPQSQVRMIPTGFSQLTAVATHKVDAAMGYAMNEPVELKSEGKAVGEFDVYHWSNLAGAGIATSDTMVSRHAGVVQAFVDASLHGLRETLRHPGQAFAISARNIPDIAPTARLQRRVLAKALRFWRPAGVALGSMDPRVWNLTAQALYQFGQIPHRVQAARYFTNRFVRAAGG